MNNPDSPAELMSAQEDAPSKRSTAFDHIWHPWYAKVWWISIPLYWVGAAASLRMPAMAEFYTSALAGFLNALFVPTTALLVLGFGFIRDWFNSPPLSNGGILTGEEIDALDREWAEHRRRVDPPDHLRPVGDIYDPFSGTSYVGNPLSPFNGSKI
jgi:hypothetical protein